MNRTPKEEVALINSAFEIYEKLVDKKSRIGRFKAVPVLTDSGWTSAEACAAFTALRKLGVMVKGPKESRDFYYKLAKSFKHLPLEEWEEALESGIKAQMTPRQIGNMSDFKRTVAPYDLGDGTKSEADAAAELVSIIEAIVAENSALKQRVDELEQQLAAISTLVPKVRSIIERYQRN